MRKIIVSKTIGDFAFALIEGSEARVYELKSNHALSVEEKDEEVRLIRTRDDRHHRNITHILVDESTTFVFEVMKAVLFTPHGKATRIVREENGEVYRESAFDGYPQTTRTNP
jgi:hypothetical protein